MLPNPDVIRTLTVILMADVAGYGELMGEDESDTIRALQERRQVFIRQTESRGGRVLDAKGDAIMVAFGSALAALVAAVAIQREIDALNEPLPEARRMRFRVGVNLGDMVEEDDTLYGDGVNIAGRLESLAEPGGVCISSSVHDQVNGKLPLEFEALGEQRVKTQTVHAYRVIVPAGAEMPAAAVVSRSPKKLGWSKIVGGVALLLAVVYVAFLATGQDVERGSEPLGEGGAAGVSLAVSATPSIAVLPFVVRGDDPEHALFASGITEDIITSLTQVRGMRVISQNSSMRYVDSPVDPKRVGSELGVRHLLEGSVRTLGDGVRVSARLVNSSTEDVEWADSWDRPTSDILALQDEITGNIINELEIELVEGEHRRITLRSTKNPKAYVALRRGVVAFESLPKTRESLIRAREWFIEATDLDSEYASAYAWISLSYVEEVVQGLSRDPIQDLAEAEVHSRRAIELDEFLSRAHDSMGWISVVRGDWEKAYEYQRAALELAPGNADVLILIGQTLCILGRAEEALVLVEKAHDLNPYPPWWYWWGLGETHLFLENYPQAFDATSRSKEMNPDFEPTRLHLIIELMAMGRNDEARDHAKLLLQSNPQALGRFIHIGPELEVISPTYLDAMKDRRLSDHFRSLISQAVQSSR